MSDGSEPVTPPQDTGMPDSVETDPAALSSAEDLDEDRLRVDPLEEGIEPPERWSEVDRYGMTPFEQRQGESLEQRVSQEESDVDAEQPAEHPTTAASTTGLDDTVDVVIDDEGKPVSPDETLTPDAEAARRGQNADEAGGSMTETIRTPEETEGRQL